MKKVTRDKVIYTFSLKNRIAARARAGELVVLETRDAFGGQIKTEKNSVETFDWSKIDGATGPVFIENAEPGDTLVAEIVNIKIPRKGVIVTVPKHGVLEKKRIRATTKIVPIEGDHVKFEKACVKIRPMIGTVGVTPRKEIPCGSLGRHGGNMDVKNLTARTKVYFPVFVEGALFAAGDIHAVQADGESCVSAIEVSGAISVKFTLIKGKKPEWPVLETEDSYAFLACGETLDEAAEFATDAAVKALMREYKWSFETAYMFASLTVNLEINQVVDPKKGVRAVIAKEFIGLDSQFT